MLEPSLNVDPKIIEHLFDLGGLIAGGAAVSLLYGNDNIKDLDFFFKDRSNYEIAKQYHNRKLDIVYSPCKNPYDSFDLSISQCYFDRYGNLTCSDLCKETYQTGVIKIIRRNIISPFATFRRSKKYCKKFGLTIDPSDLDLLTGRTL